MEPTPTLLRRLYVDMVRSRTFEETVIALVGEGRVPGSWLSGIGQEGTIGALGQLRPDDLVTYSHRGAYAFLSRGCDPKRLLAELLGKVDGYCRGKGGRHLADVEHGIFGKSGTIGGHAPIAAGLATAIQIRGGDQVVLSIFGEGTSNRGNVHEAMNLAAVRKLPVVWICENNGYAGSSPASAILAVERVEEMGAAYGMPSERVDGNDVFAVLDAVRPAIRRAREGAGPSLVELTTYRVRPFGESWDDDRDRAEVEEWRARDPLERFRRRLLEIGVLDPDSIAAIAAEARREMESARSFAEASPFPAPEEAFEDLWAGEEDRCER